MPVVILRAADFGKTGDETPEQLEAERRAEGARRERSGSQLGPRMNLGDVTKKTVPKMCLVSPPRHGGAISHAHVHSASRARGDRRARRGQRRDRVRAAGLGRGAGREASRRSATRQRLEVEHPTGFFTVDMEVERRRAATSKVRRSALLRTARKLMRGEVFVPGARVERRMSDVCASVCSASAKSARRSPPICWRAACAQSRAWDMLFRDRGQRAARVRAAAACVRAQRTQRARSRTRDLVISAVTAAQDVDAARSVSRPHLQRGAFFLDLNSVSPGVKRERAQHRRAAGGRYVEAAIMSPIAPKRIASPMLLGGPHAAEFLPLAQPLGFTGAEVFSDRDRPRVGGEDVSQRHGQGHGGAADRVAADGAPLRRRGRRCSIRCATCFPATDWRELGALHDLALAACTAAGAPRRCAKSRGRSPRRASSRG